MIHSPSAFELIGNHHTTSRLTSKEAITPSPRAIQRAVPAAPAGYLYGATVDFVSQHKLTALGMTPVALGYRLSFLVCGLFILSGIVVAVALLPKQPRAPTD